MTERKYLPTFAELVDRLSITILKSIFIPEHKTEYDAECALIMHDIDVLLTEKNYKISAVDIKAISVLTLANRVIWENESVARAGGEEAEGRLRLTHSVNGCRNTAKNIIAVAVGDRLDYKVDCLAADLEAKYGNWRLFEDAKTQSLLQSKIRIKKT